MLSQPLTLRFPVHLPGGTVENVTPRPLAGFALRELLSGEVDAEHVVAKNLRLPVDVIRDLDVTDYDRVRGAISKLSGATRGEALMEMRGKFAVIEGNAE